MKTEHYHYITVRRCTRDGLGHCSLCSELRIIRTLWIYNLNEVLIDGEPIEGYFCDEHADEVANELRHDLNQPSYCPYESCARAGSMYCEDCIPTDPYCSLYLPGDGGGSE